MDTFGPPPPGSGKELITIRHLLEHKSGFVNPPSGDPLFVSLGDSQWKMISDYLAKVDLATAPGSTFAYSNMGYIVLGRVIERVGGLAYEEHLKARLLRRCGIEQMEVGGGTLGDRFPNEVKYYNPHEGQSADHWGVPPYSMNVARMDAAGGWIASATDLMRFMVRIDKRGTIPDILPAATLDQLYFGGAAWSHAGYLPGNLSMFEKVDDTFLFAILVNTSNTDASRILIDLPAAVKAHVRDRRVWPLYDLF